MEYLSLFDYLGKPAGGDLGKAVFQAAKAKKIKFQTKIVPYSRFKDGTIIMYPKLFLDGYFSKN